MKQNLLVKFSLIFLLVLCHPVYADDLVLGTTVNLAAFHDDQFDIQIDDSETEAVVYRPTIELGYEGQRYQSTFAIGAVYNEFINSAIDNTTNFNVSWDQQRTNERSEVGLGIDYSERLVAQLIEFDDTLGVSSNNTVTSLSLMPTYSKSLSETSTIDLSYQYTETEVDTADLGGNENVLHRFSGSWLRALSPRSTLAVNLNYLASRPQDTEFQAYTAANVYGATIGGQFELNSRWVLEGGIGASIADIDEDRAISSDDILVVRDGDVQFMSALDVTYNGLRNTLFISVDAGATQQLDGVIDDQFVVGLGWARQLNEALSANFTGSYFHAERSDRDVYTADVSLAWQPSARWQYRLGYRYREQAFLVDEVTRLEDEGESNRVTLTLEYAFEDMMFGI